MSEYSLIPLELLATSNAIEGVQDTYYGLTNQKEKEAINPGKILFGENEYMILDNISASGVPYAIQVGSYTNTKEEIIKLNGELNTKIPNNDAYYDGRKIYTEKELNNLKKTTGSANKGIEYIYEGPKGNEKAQIFQSGTTGALSDVATKKGVIPALRYDNPNTRGRDYIKFDGIKIVDGQTYLIDSKTNIPYWNKKAMDTTFGDTLDRIAEAKKQNPNIKIVYEFPNNEVKNKLIEWLKRSENLNHKNTIDIIKVRGEK